MRPEGTSARATLEAWRAAGEDRMDRVRFALIDALETRARDQQGQTRQLLDARLDALLKAYADDLAHAADNARQPTRASTPAPERLGALLRHVGDTTLSLGASFTLPGGAAPASAFPELPALDAFRQLWSQVRTDSQLRQSLEQVPTDAGPLNSSVLVHRAITLMRDVSPGYLQHFMAYVDILSGLEQMQHGGALATRDAPLTEAGAKRPRAKPRKRRS